MKNKHAYVIETTLLSDEFENLMSTVGISGYCAEEPGENGQITQASANIPEDFEYYW